MRKNEKAEITENNCTFFSVCLFEQNNLYLITDMSFIPVNYDIESDKVKCLVPYNSLEDLTGASPEIIVKKNETIISVKNNGKSIIVIDIAKKEYKEIPINASFKPYDNFALVTLYGNNLFCFCRTDSKVIVFDTTSFEIREIMIPQICEGGYRTGICEENTVYLFPISGNSYLEFDMDDCTYSTKYLSETITKIVHVQKDGENIFVLDWYGYIRIFNTTSGTIYTSVKVGGEAEYGIILITKERLMILPNQGEKILMSNTNLKCVTEFNDYPKDFKYDDIVGENKSKFIYPCEDEETYYFAPRKANYILKIRKSTKFEYEWIKTPKIVNRIFAQKDIDNKSVVYEDDNCSLYNLIDYMRV